MFVVNVYMFTVGTPDALLLLTPLVAWPGGGGYVTLACLQNLRALMIIIHARDTNLLQQSVLSGELFLKKNELQQLQRTSSVRSKI